MVLNTSSLLTAVFLVFFCLIMVPLDGIEHAYTKDEKLKRGKRTMGNQSTQLESDI